MLDTHVLRTSAGNLNTSQLDMLHSAHMVSRVLCVRNGLRYNAPVPHCSIATALPSESC